MSGLLSISGLASGLDYDSIIEKIMEFEARPVADFESRIAVKKKILFGFDNFEAQVQALRGNFSKVSSAIGFRGKLAGSSDDSILTASASTSAATGIFTLTVDQLAQSHQVASDLAQGYASRTTEVGTGTFSLTVGNRSRVDITIDESNNSLDGLMEAINNADAGASASIINSGDPDNPYVLLITGEGTGSNQRVIVDHNLSGGQAPQFGSVSAVVDGVKTGTSNVTSSGNYTGDGNDTLTYTVTGGGTIGVDNIIVAYDNGDGLTGTFTVSSDYVPGEEVHVFGGLNLSFSAGSLNTNDTWSTDATSASIQAPLDARFTLGNTLGGSTGITLTSETNTVSNVIDGLTFNLHKASTDAVTINVEANTKAIKENISGMVEQYNSFVDMMDELFYYDQDTGEKGVLLGDRITIELYNEFQRMLTSVAEGVTGSFKSLADVGITFSGDGRLKLEESVLSEALRDDLDSVLQLFATDGRTTDGDIRFLGASENTRAYSVTGVFQQGYNIQITQAAEKALLSGAQLANPSQSSPIVVDGGNSTFRIKFGSHSTGDLLIAEGVYQSGQALAAEIQAKINASGELPNDALSVRYVDDGGGNGHFEFNSAGYGSSQTVEIESAGNSIYSAIGLTAGDTAIGRDVTGTINGEAAKGVGQILTGEDDNEYTDGLQLLVSITPDELISQGPDQGNVLVTKGVGAKLKELTLRITNQDNGDATIRRNALNDQIDVLDGQIDAMTDRLELKRERLTAEFLELESVLAQLQAEQDYLSQGLASLSALASQVKINK